MIKIHSKAYEHWNYFRSKAQSQMATIQYSINKSIYITYPPPPVDGQGVLLSYVERFLNHANDIGSGERSIQKSVPLRIVSLVINAQLTTAFMRSTVLLVLPYGSEI